MVWLDYDPHLEEIVVNGKLMTGPVSFGPDEPSQCDLNVTKLWVHDKARFRVCTGCALYSDGLWRPHSWASDGTRLIETTELRDRYYGVVLSQADAQDFALASLAREVKRLTFMNTISLPPGVKHRCIDCEHSLDGD